MCINYLSNVKTLLVPIWQTRNNVYKTFIFYIVWGEIYTLSTAKRVKWFDEIKIGYTV